MAAMKNLHLFLLPGLLNDARLWQHQVSGLSNMAHASVADLTGADSISSLASAALAQAPAERFALAGLSMGGYVALEIMRQAPEQEGIGVRPCINT
jgi:pimeloyl-ACP methyl ester carboxylesterase